jgi:hypothetical protein
LPEGFRAFAANVLWCQAKIAQKVLVNLGEVEALQMAVIPPRQQPQMHPAQDHERRRPTAEAADRHGGGNGSCGHRRLLDLGAG